MKLSLSFLLQLRTGDRGRLCCRAWLGNAVVRGGVLVFSKSPLHAVLPTGAQDGNSPFEEPEASTLGRLPVPFLACFSASNVPAPYPHPSLVPGPSAQTSLLSCNPPSYPRHLSPYRKRLQLLHLLLQLTKLLCGFTEK